MDDRNITQLTEVSLLYVETTRSADKQLRVGRNLLYTQSKHRQFGTATAKTTSSQTSPS